MKRSKSKTPGDFPKKRRSVGKGKRAPDNATEVSFKSRAVAIPPQLVQRAEPTTNRKLPLQVSTHARTHTQRGGGEGGDDLMHLPRLDVLAEKWRAHFHYLHVFEQKGRSRSKNENKR